MTVVLVVLFGCSLSAGFGWFLNSALRRYIIPERMAQSWRAAYEMGERDGYREGYNTGYAAPIRRQIEGGN